MTRCTACNRRMEDVRLGTPAQASRLPSRAWCCQDCRAYLRRQYGRKGWTPDALGPDDALTLDAIYPEPHPLDTSERALSGDVSDLPMSRVRGELARCTLRMTLEDGSSPWLRERFEALKRQGGQP
jgi:hypothetical protein